MKDRSILSSIIICMGLAATPALAQESFTGFRVEGVAGWDNFSASRATSVIDRPDAARIDWGDEEEDD